MSMTPEEMQKKIEELTGQVTGLTGEKEKLQIEKDAAENLLRNIDIKPDRKAETKPDNSGNGNTDETEKILQQILSGFTDEQLQDPATLRKLMLQFGKKAVEIALTGSTRASIDVMGKALDVRAATEAIVNAWRRDNPDIANNKRIEDMVENVLMKEVNVDPVHKNKSLRERIDVATDITREFLDLKKEEGRDEEKEKKNVKLQTTLSPSKGGSGGSGGGKGKEEKEEKPKTDEENVSSFLKSRREAMAKKM